MEDDESEHEQNKPVCERHGGISSSGGSNPPEQQLEARRTVHPQQETRVFRRCCECVKWETLVRKSKSVFARVSQQFYARIHSSQNSLSVLNRGSGVFHRRRNR